MTAEIHRPGDRRDGERIADRHWSARALELAVSADFRTSPNPMVGAVVLDREGQIAGEGYHKGPGQPHAEQEALAQAGERAKGGTLYINLEPCTHAHRTPNCAEAVIESGIYRTVISMTDPDERVRGAGVKALESAHVRVDLGMHEDRARRLNEFYVKHRLTGRPFVTAKFAISLLVEGGAEIHAAMLSEQLVDKVFAYVGPKLIGGREAPGPLGGKGIERLAEATGLHDLDVTRLGDDFLISGYVNVHRDR